MVKRIAWIDIGKAVAILCVVYGHTIASKAAVSATIVTSFHMPLFFLFAGYTFSVRPMRFVVIRSARRLLVPYVLLFSLLFLALVLNTGSISAGFFIGQVARFVFASAVNPPQAGIRSVGIIWFLVAMFLSRVGLNALLLASRDWSHRYIRCSLILIAFVSVGICVGHYYFLPLSIDVVPLTTAYMFVGYLGREYGVMERKMHPVVFMAILAFWCLDIYLGWFSIGERDYGVVPISILGAIAGTVVVAKLCQAIERLGGPLRSAMTFVGINSLLVFSFHYLELNYLKWDSFPFVQAFGSTKLMIFVVRTIFIILLVCIATALGPSISKERNASDTDSENLSKGEVQ